MAISTRMKRQIWLGASLLLNLALAVLVMSLLLHRSPLQADSSPDSPDATAGAVHVEAPIATAVSTNHTPANREQWLDSLRRAGAPDWLLAGVVTTDFENRWGDKRRELQKRYDRGEISDDDMARFDQQHDIELEKELRGSLGDEGFRQWDKQNLMRMYGFDKLNLTSAESDSLYQLRKDLDRKQREAELALRNGDIDNADFNDQQTAAQQAYDKQLKALLGDDRYTAMQSGDDELKGALRRTLKNLNATDTQFQAMLDAQSQWNQRRADLDRQLQDAQNQGKSFEDQMKAIDAARDQEYQRLLGTNGFNQMQELQDGRYQTMKRYENAWQLSDNDIDYLYKTLQYCQASIQEYQQKVQAAEKNGETIDWPEVQRRIKEFSDQTLVTVHDYLGDDRFNRLKRNDLFNFGDTGQ